MIPFLQWDLDLGRIKYIILKVFPWRQDPTPRSREWGQKLFAKILRGEKGISRHCNFSKKSKMKLAVSAVATSRNSRNLMSSDEPFW